MVYGDQGRTLCKSITLDHDKTKPPPELLCLRIERSSARDKRPELPSKKVMNSAEAPPTTNKLLIRCGRTLSPKPVPSSLCFEVALNLVFDCLDDAGHGYDHGNFLVLNRLNDLRRAQRFLKQNRTADKLWNEES